MERDRRLRRRFDHLLRALRDYATAAIERPPVDAVRVTMAISDFPHPRLSASAFKGITRLPPGAGLLVCVTMSLLICGGLLIYGAGRGADLTDEIFYLIWARDPDAYALNYQPFGYLLHPLFRLAGGDLQAYRLMGFTIAAAAGALLGRSLSVAGYTPVVFSIYGALAALTIFYPWIITPSYNSAANVGAMLVIAGLPNIRTDQPRRRAAGVLATAAGLCVAAFAKPPLFALATVALLIAAAIARNRWTTLTMLAALALAAMLIASVLAPADVVALVARMAASQHVLALPNAPLSLPAKIARDWLLVPPVLSGATIAATSALCLRQYRWSTWLAYLAIALSLFYIGSIASDAIDGDLPDFIGLALVIAAAGYVRLRLGDKIGLLAIGLLIGAPCAVALGTFNNQWAQLNFSMAFPFLALFALAASDRVRCRRISAQTLTVLGPIAVMLLAAWHPYSLPASIFEQQVPIRHPLTQSPILVDPETASFVRAGHGLAQGALLIDLSGTGPGVAAVLGARAPVLPWLNPATPTWPDVVWARLTVQDRARTWIVGPTWPPFTRSAPARWLANHRSRYCSRALPELPFWGKERVLSVWLPCQ